jgi:hypothetical protein
VRSHRTRGLPLRVVEVLALDEVVAADLLLGFGERPVDDGQLAVLATNGGGGQLDCSLALAR